jgi:hypothetical protein
MGSPITGPGRPLRIDRSGIDGRAPGDTPIGIDGRTRPAMMSAPIRSADEGPHAAVLLTNLQQPAATSSRQAGSRIGDNDGADAAEEDDRRRDDWPRRQAEASRECRAVRRRAPGLLLLMMMMASRWSLRRSADLVTERPRLPPGSGGSAVDITASARPGLGAAPVEAQRLISSSPRPPPPVVEARPRRQLDRANRFSKTQ